MELFKHSDTMQETFWIIAIAASLIFLIQTVLTFMGADAADGIDADFEGDFDNTDAPFQLFSFRNLIHFLLGFSWAGVSFYALISNKYILVGTAVIIGLLFVYLFFLIVRQLQKLAEDNTFKISQALHKTGEVYIPVPERKSGTGKVIISINGSVRELDALTEHEKIGSNTKVKVTGIEGNNILIVEQIN